VCFCPSLYERNDYSAHRGRLTPPNNISTVCGMLLRVPLSCAEDYLVIFTPRSDVRIIGLTELYRRPGRRIASFTSNSTPHIRLI